MLLSFLALLWSWSLGSNPGIQSQPVLLQPIVEQSSIGPQRVNPENLGIVVTALSAIAVDEKTGAVLFEKNADQERPLASLTKLWTAKAVKQVLKDPQSIITMTQADNRNGSASRVYAGERVALNDAIALMMIASDNSMAVALSRVASQQENIAVSELLNNISTSLEIIHTDIQEPTGLSANNISTARDVAHMAQTIFSDKELTTLLGMPEYQFRIQGSNRLVRFDNTNKLLAQDWPYIIAGKTGFTEEAGGNLIVLAQDESGNRIIIAVMGIASNEDRFQDVKNIIHWVFGNWEWKKSGEAQ